MFLLPALGFGLLLAVVLGGKLSRLLEVRFRLTWTVWLALAAQVVLFSRLGTFVAEHLRGPAHIGTYGLLLAFAAANVRIRPLLLVPFGMLLNAIAIAANGGRMPVDPGAASAAGFADASLGNVSESADRLRFLGDVFALPDVLPLANVFSIGDLLIGFGVVAFIVIVATDDGRESALSFSRLLTPLRDEAYRRLAAGKLVSSIGDWLTLAALIGWIYQETGSTGQVAGLLLLRLAPPILGGSLAAVLIDRLPKQRVLVWIELGRGLAVGAALAGVVADHRLAVFAALACSGALAAISNAAVPALLPSLLPANQLASANAGLGLAKDGAMAIGALGAGAALSWLGPEAALVADLATFAVAFALFSGLPLTRALLWAPHEAEARAVGGLRYLLGRRSLVLLVLSFAAATLATGLTNASFPRFLEDEIGFGSGGYGFAIAALATGLALGQALVGFARVGPTAGRWIGAGLVVMAGLFVLLGLTDHAPTVLLVVAMIGFIDGTTDVLFETVVQRETDPRRYGAVFGLASAFITTTMMSAVAVAPVLNRILEPHEVIIGASSFLLVAGVIGLVGMTSAKPVEPQEERIPPRPLVLPPIGVSANGNGQPRAAGRPAPGRRHLDPHMGAAPRDGRGRGRGARPGGRFR